MGIPMTRLAKSEEGGLILPDGQTGRLVANEDAFAREILGLPTAVVPGEAAGAAAAPAAEASGPAAPEQPAEAGQPLLLDNKPHDVKAEAASTPKAALGDGSGSQLALPRLAGECDGCAVWVGILAACFRCLLSVGFKVVLAALLCHCFSYPGCFPMAAALESP